MGGANPLLYEPAVDPANPLQAGTPTLADAWQYNANAYQQWVAQQRHDAVMRGLVDPDSGWPTERGLVDAAQQFGSALIGSTVSPGTRMPSGLVDVGNVAAHVNPSRSDIARMMQASPGYKLRALVEGPNHAIWTAYDATHAQMAQALGFTGKAARLSYMGREGPPDADFQQQAGRFSFMPVDQN